MPEPRFPYSLHEFIGQHHHNGCKGGVDETHVRAWQQRMSARGRSIDVDGCFGPQSEHICRSFQAKHNLPVTGQVDIRTWNAAWARIISHNTWREKLAIWHDGHVGMTEFPPGSNCDLRVNGIRAAQDGCADGKWLRNEPWCGVWVWAGLHAAGLVKNGVSWLASVSSIEDHARAGKGPFRGWTTDGSKVKLGDVVVLFGRGIHVGTVRGIDSVHVHTWEGNTSSGISGSQSNGGGAFKRSRTRQNEVHGYALVREE